MEYLDLTYCMTSLKNSLLLLSLLFIWGCGQCQNASRSPSAWFIPNDKIKVLSTTSMIGDIVQAIGEGHIDSFVLIQGELDPHSYQLVKGDDEKLAFADLIFYNGLNLEHGPSLQHALKDSLKSVALGDLLYKEHPELILMVKGQKDPHIWMDVSLWTKTVPYIVEALSKRDPSHAADYQANGDKLKIKLDTLHQEMRSLVQKVPDDKRFLVTSHDAFNYFARGYLASDDEIKNNNWQKRFEAPEGLAPESQLSAADIRHILEHVKLYHIHVLFPESNVSQDSIRKVANAAQEIGLNVRVAKNVLYGDALGGVGSEAETYTKMQEHNAKAISHNLMHE